MIESSDLHALSEMIGDDDRAARARHEMRSGAPVAIVHGDSAWVALSAETLRPERFDRLRSALGRDDWRIAVTARRAETLKARVYDRDIARISLRFDASAAEIRAIADPAAALDHPLTGPHASIRDGSATDVAAARWAIATARQARLLPAAAYRPFASRADAEAFAAAADVILFDLGTTEARPSRWSEASSARVPIGGAPNMRFRLFRRDGDETEHYALEIGDVRRGAPVLARLHSACATGDIFGSLKCDCGPQLQAALTRIAADGGGVLVYLNQEGRGIGLANKLRAYRLQDQGFDTVEANHRLGFHDDERALTDGAEILAALGVRRVRLMTNNPAKVAALEATGLTVTERVPLAVGRTEENDRYLAVKAEKSGHLL